MEKFPYVDRDRKVSRELGLFQQDIRCLSISKIKKVKAFSYMIMQLKRFTRDELCMLTEYCDALIKEKEQAKGPIIDDPDTGLIGVADILIDQYQNYQKK